MKLPLEHLRTEVPLSEFDYAAVRARVRSEIARPRKFFVWRLAAAAALVLIALQVREPSRSAAAKPPLLASKPEARAASVTQSGGSATALPEPRKRIARRRHVKPATAVTRIEIHTADPDIRIIWIVPKENS